MKAHLRSTALAMVMPISLFVSPTSGEASGNRELIVTGDLSDSAGLTADDFTAEQAAQHVERRIAALSPGDTVRVRTLGIAGVSAPQLHIDVTLGKKSQTRPQRIAPQIASIIRSLPELTRNGKITPEVQTNIVGFVEALAPSLDCANVETTIVIFSDAIEWSTYVKGSELLSGATDLPSPSGPILEGCHIEMRGVGQQASKLGTDPRWFPLLKDQWSRFMTAAGAKSFKAYAYPND